MNKHFQILVIVIAASFTYSASAQTNPAPHETQQAVQMLKDFEEKIKRGDQGEPLRLTPEMDAKLVKEGLLPPLGEIPVVVSNGTTRPRYETILSMAIDEAPLDLVMELYQEYTDRMVILQSGLTGQITIITNGVTVPEAVSLIEKELAKQSLEIVTTDEGFLRVQKQ